MKPNRVLTTWTIVILSLIAIDHGRCQDKITVSHALAMAGKPKYDQEFTHFEYANPAAIKAGSISLAVASSSGFDSLNPFVTKGIAAAGMSYLGRSLFYDSLTTQSGDEAFTQYGLVAEKMEMPEDRSWIIFHSCGEAMIKT